MSWWFRTCITTTTMGVTYACWNWTNSGFLTFSCWQLGLVICIRYCWCSAAFLQALMNIPRGNIISDWEHWPAAWASQVVLVVKNLPANAGDKRDVGSIPGSGRSPGGGHGNSLQYSCLENPRDRGAQGLKSIGSQRVGHSTHTWPTAWKIEVSRQNSN